MRFHQSQKLLVYRLTYLRSFLQGHFVQDGGATQLVEAIIAFIDQNPPPTTGKL